MIKHYSMDSCTGEWLRECVRDETEEATVVLSVIPKEFFVADEVLSMTREEIEAELAREFNERRVA